MRQDLNCRLSPNFWTIIVASFIAAGLLTGCSKEQGPVTSSNSKYESADKDDNDTQVTPAVSNPANSSSDGSTPSGSGQPGQEKDVAGQPNSTGGQPVSSTPPIQPPSVAKDDLDNLTIPEGTPEELLKFAISLAQRRPSGETREEFMSNLTKIQNIRLQTADKILAAQSDEETRIAACHIKLDALGTLMQLQKPGADKNIRDFCRSLKDEKIASLAHMGRLLSFGFMVEDFTQAKDADSKPVMDELKSLLAELELKQDVLQVCQQAATQLFESKHKQQALELLQLTGEAFKKVEDKQLASAGSQLLEQSRLVEMQFGEKLDAAIKGQEGAMAAFMETTEKLLADPGRGASILDTLGKVAQYFEVSGKYTEAGKIYAGIGQSYKDNPDKEIAEVAARKAEFGTRRMSLIGQTFQIDGVLPNGSTFDWNQYKGKVVLVDFWATWCGPCMQELPNVRANYDKYHELGFEVVGVNINDRNDESQKQQLDEYLKQAKLPWTTVISSDLKTQGFDDPNAVKCGVEGIPFMLLVDREGKVVALHTRGPALGEKLAELLGDGKTNGAEKPANKTGQVAPAASPLDGPTYFTALLAEEEDDEEDAEAENLYLAEEGLTPAELVDFILDMQEKPKVIQERPGFREAVVDAAERVLAEETRDRYHVIAAEAKFETLHKMASFGDDKADKKLMEFVTAMQGDTRKRIASQVSFFQIERKAIDAADLPKEKIPEVLDELKAYIAKEKLTTKHLRMASSTVGAINKLDDQKDEAKKKHYGEMREKYFAEFGKLFAASSDKQLASYGKKLAKSSTPGGGTIPSDLVGKPLILEGTTAAGADFDWKSYRGKVVLVDFWATWCGPCRREMPHVKQFYEQHKEKGFDVVGVSLDKDLDALAKYLEDNNIAWTNLSGEGTSDLARRYGVRGIPTMMLIDQEGRIVAVSHKLSALTAKAEELLAPAKDKPAKAEAPAKAKAQ